MHLKPAPSRRQAATLLADAATPCSAPALAFSAARRRAAARRACPSRTLTRASTLSRRLARAWPYVHHRPRAWTSPLSARGDDHGQAAHCRSARCNLARSQGCTRFARRADGTGRAVGACRARNLAQGRAWTGRGSERNGSAAPRAAHAAGSPWGAAARLFDSVFTATPRKESGARGKAGHTGVGRRSSRSLRQAMVREWVGFSLCRPGFTSHRLHSPALSSRSPRVPRARARPHASRRRASTVAATRRTHAPARPG